MAVSSVAHAAIDGGLVEIAGPVDLRSPPTSVVVAIVAGRQYEFTSGRLGFGETIAAEFGISLDEEYAFQGGRLRVGTALVADPTNQRENVFNMAVWEGKNYSLEIGSYDVASSGLIALFGMLTITETDQGVTLAPMDANELTLARSGGQQPELVKWVPAVGLLEIWQRTAEADVELPPWPGIEVIGGELFVEMKLGGRTLFLLVGETSVTRIYSDEDVSLNLVTDGLEKVSVGWKTSSV
jgi:hypothetical protein